MKMGEDPESKVCEEQLRSLRCVGPRAEELRGGPMADAQGAEGQSWALLSHDRRVTIPQRTAWSSFQGRVKLDGG